MMPAALHTSRAKSPATMCFQKFEYQGICNRLPVQANHAPGILREVGNRRDSVPVSGMQC